MTDAPMSTRCSIRWEQALFYPVDNRSGVHMKETTNIMCCIDGLARCFGRIHHDRQETLGPHFTIRFGANGSLSQFILKFAMEINIRDWNRQDLTQIQIAWLDYCQNVARSDMRLRPDAQSAMKQWLAFRFRQPHSLGFVAEADGNVAGFLIGRID